jgi:hypothetical protein
MEELLQQLVESDLLTEDTKKELTEAISKQIEEAKEAAIVEAKAEVEAQVRVDLQEQYQADREALIEALDTKTEEYLKEELEELRDDIERFRDLEVEYADKLEEAKEELAQVLKGDLEELVETIDQFLDMALENEMSELKEDLKNVQRLQFGKEVYEAFEGVFSKKFVDENGLESDLKEKEERLTDLSDQLEEASKELETMCRENKMTEVLSSLHGRSRDVMEAVLRNIPTNKLVEAYEHYIPKVLNESAEEPVVESEKENEKSSVLAEGDDSAKADELKKGEVVSTGDTESQQLEEAVEDEVPASVRAEIARLRHLSGIH